MNTKNLFLLITLLILVVFYIGGVHADDRARFMSISEKMSANMQKVLNAHTANVVYLIKEFTPIAEEKKKRNIEVLEKLREHDRQMWQKFYEDCPDHFTREEIEQKIQDSYKRQEAEFFTPVQYCLSSYYYKRGKVRKEELHFNNNRNRPLPEILKDIQTDTESVRGMLVYKINNGDYFCNDTRGTSPLDSVTKEDAREEYTATIILDPQVAVKHRVEAEIGSVARSEPDGLEFLKFGIDSVSAADLKVFFQHTNIPVSVSESIVNAEKIIVCTFGALKKGTPYSMIKVLPDKGYAITYFAFIYNDVPSLEYTFEDFIRIEQGIWAPQHIILKNRILPGKDDSACSITEFLAVKPLTLGIDIDERLFAIHLTSAEKEQLSDAKVMDEHILVERRAFDVPEELHQMRQAAAHDFYLRISFFILGVVFIFLGIYFSRREKRRK